MLCADSDQILQRMIMPPPSTTTATNYISSENKSVVMQKQEQLKCPRCDSANTKFCYFNNYNLSQPRHFCKACKRYWTRGGTLRNVPVGGGCRKNKKVKKNGSTQIKTNPNPNPRSNLNPIHFNPVPSAEINSFIYDHMNLSTAAYDNRSSSNNLNVQPQLSSSLGLSGLMINNNPSYQLSCFLGNGYTSFGSEEAASILVSSLKQPKNEYSFLPSEDLQQIGHDNHYNFLVDDNYPINQGMSSNVANINGASDSAMYWNMAIGSSGWSDATN